MPTSREIVIRAHGLGKQYHLAASQARHLTLRDALSAAGRRATALLGRLAGQNGKEPRSADRTFWALQDVSFDLGRGEVLGIIGANGAGKSTLLKILARVTSPTTGHATVFGRIGSLLEVGTGFHPELSGRENIYLNGAILGMRRAEIARRFDEIVAFAEVEEFIDVAIKHYSSGMYLRLAFAVAAHLEPEILIVDEVLAVGDAAFQKKCLGRMSTVAGEGRTVLFVSHNLDAVQRLCSRCLHLQRGRLVADGEVAPVIAGYLHGQSDRILPHQQVDLSGATRRGNGAVRFVSASFSSGSTETGLFAYTFGPLEFDLRIHSDRQRAVPSLAVFLRSQNGAKLINADTLAQGTVLELRPGLNRVRLRIDELWLNPGTYEVGFWVAGAIDLVYDHLEAAFNLEVMPSPAQGHGITPRWNGLVAVRFEVTTETDPLTYSAITPADASMV